jgi:transposase
MAGPGLLAYILTSKFDDHLPLYRLNEIFTRMGADIPDTTLVDWCGRAMKTLQPVIELIGKEIMASDLLHADDTPIRVLDRSQKDKGLGKGVRQGRIWVYVRNQRRRTKGAPLAQRAGTAPPGAVYRFSPDRKGKHPKDHLKHSSGILQADAYSGFRDLYEPGADGTAQFREAACWAHLRRDFHDVWTSNKSGIAKEALDRIGKLYDIERQIAGQPADVRHAVRQEKSNPKVEAFRTWAEQQLTRLPGKSDLAKAFRYGLSRWDSFTLFLDDGRVAIDNNSAERGMRPIGVGRRNWLFAGSDTGGETRARAMTIIGLSEPWGGGIAYCPASSKESDSPPALPTATPTQAALLAPTEQIAAPRFSNSSYTETCEPSEARTRLRCIKAVGHASRSWRGSVPLHGTRRYFVRSIHSHTSAGWS